MGLSNPPINVPVVDQNAYVEWSLGIGASSAEEAFVTPTAGVV